MKARKAWVLRQNPPQMRQGRPPSSHVNRLSWQVEAFQSLLLRQQIHEIVPWVPTMPTDVGSRKVVLTDGGLKRLESSPQKPEGQRVLTGSMKTTSLVF